MMVKIDGGMLVLILLAIWWWRAELAKAPPAPVKKSEIQK
jgi:hypothetical protein